MKYITTIFLQIFTTSALAAGVAPPLVPPVEIDGVRYTAPNKNGTKAYVEAWDVRKSNLLWKTEVFRTRINPDYEGDVQFVYIKELTATNDLLRVRAGHGQEYFIDPVKGEVRSNKHLYMLALFLTIVIGGSIAIWVMMRRQQFGNPFNAELNRDTFATALNHAILLSIFLGIVYLFAPLSWDMLSTKLYARGLSFSGYLFFLTGHPIYENPVIAIATGIIFLNAEIRYYRRLYQNKGKQSAVIWSCAITVMLAAAICWFLIIIPLYLNWIDDTKMDELWEYFKRNRVL